MIRFNNIFKTFRTPEGIVGAVSGLSFDVPTGSFFTLVGPSGCGKTTTMRMLAGLERPDSGTIQIGDRTVFSSEQRTNVAANRRNLSMVFQSYAIWPHMTVAANVGYPLRVKRVGRREIQRRVDEVLELVGLGGMGSRQATRLSGGQQQRVALARALVPDPQVLLLDEPLSNLDARLRAHMRIELKELQRRIGVTTIYVTHDQQEALAMSDELVVMEAGTIAQRGTPEDIYFRPRKRFTAEFIGSTNLLAATSAGPLQVGVNELQTALGPLQAWVVEEVAPERREFLVSIRPEVFVMRDLDSHMAGRHGPDQCNEFEGTIETLVFLGESTDCTVRVRDEVVSVKSTALKPSPMGTRVRLQVSAENCTVLVDEGDDVVGVARSAEGEPPPAGVGRMGAIPDMR